MVDRTYENLDIHIGFPNAQQEYPVLVGYSEGGGRTEKPYLLKIPFDDFDFTDLVDFVNDLIATDDDALAVGKKLTALLLQGDDVRNMFISRLAIATHLKRRLRLRLRIDPPELSRLPWELCYFEGQINNYFALNLQTPLVRYVAQPIDEGEIEALPSQVKVMLAIANPNNDLDVDQEEKKICDALKLLPEDTQVEVVIKRDVNWHSLQTALNEEQPHVLHFIGHGEFLEEEDEGALLLHKRDAKGARPLLASGIKPMIRGVQSLKVVVLNACNSGKVGMKRASRGVAQAIIEAGVPAVVAMQTRIPDDIAIEFAHIFYAQLAKAEPLDVAVTQMRIGANAGGYLGCVPILFMRDSGMGRVWKPRGEAEDVAEMDDGSDGEMSTAVFQPLLNLDYVAQTDSFLDIEQNVAASLLSSEPAPINNNTNNLRLLLRRLMQMMHNSVNLQPLKLDVNPKNPNAPVAPDGYWFQLAHFLQKDVSGFSQPYSEADKQAIVNETITWLETMPLVMVMEQLTPNTYRDIVTHFWQPLREKLLVATLANQLILFLLDNAGFYHEMPQIYPISGEIGFHVEMPVVKAFDARILKRWLRKAQHEAQDERMKALVRDKDSVDRILARSSDGVPEMVLKYICDTCGYEWEGLFSAWLKP